MSIWARTRALIRRELELAIPPQLWLGHFLGGVALSLFLLEVFTGILLMVYYRPTTAEAYNSIQYIMSTPQLGWLVRGLHRWGADLLILVILLHLLRVYWQCAYRERELNWAIGFLLLLLILAFGFTGMLLPWDQQAFWTTDAARRAITHVPVLGKLFLDFLWGGVELGQGALMRFYVFHVGLLPWITIFLIAAHLYLVGRQGLFAPSSTSAKEHAKTMAEVPSDAE